MESQPQNPEFRNNPENFHDKRRHTFRFHWLVQIKSELFHLRTIVIKITDPIFKLRSLEKLHMEFRIALCA